ncbi:MAG: YidC/Oxa1 family membrane protein insertase [Gemmiger sp.]
MSFFGFLAVVLGPLMRMLYQLIPNFAITMIVFTVLIRVAMMPLAIKQQKSTAKMSVFQPEIQRIQEKYKNNQQKQQEELMRLQQEYGYNPMSGCLPMLLNMLVLFGIIEVVYRPVQYILGIPTEAIKTACEAIGIATNNPITMQTSLIQQVHQGLAAGIETGLSDAQLASIQNFNTVFLGMDMCDIPGLRITPLMIFPLIAAVTMIASYVIVQKLSGTGAQMQGSMKVTMWIMNIWFIYYCFTAPVGFSIYYGTSNLCQIVQSFISYKIYSPEKFKAEYEAELAAKKAAKKQVQEITVKENGAEVTKKVNQSELNKLRLEMARRQDEELYKDERTTPLAKEE